MNYGYVNFGNGTRLYYLVLIFICIFVCVATFVNSKNYYNALGNEDENTDYGFSKSGLNALLTFNIILFVIGVVALCLNTVFLIGTFYKYKEEIEEPVPKDNDIGTILGIERKISEEFNGNFVDIKITTYGATEEELKKYKEYVPKSIEATVKDIALQVYRRGGITYNDALDYSKYLVSKVVKNDTTSESLNVKLYLSKLEYNELRKKYKESSEELIENQTILSDYEKKLNILNIQKSKLNKTEPKFRVQEYKFDSQIRENERNITELQNDIQKLKEELPGIKNKLLLNEDKDVLHIPINSKEIEDKISTTNVGIFTRFIHYMTNRHEGIGEDNYTLNEIIES